MPNTQTTCFVQYFHIQIFCNIILNLILYHSYIEKVGVGTFGGSIGRLVHYQATLLVFLDELDLSSMVRTIVLAFLGCWAFIGLALVTPFQQDDTRTITTLEKLLENPGRPLIGFLPQHNKHFQI
jgi:hypothetical protein